VQKSKYTVEFKQQAISLSEDLGSVRKAAEQLGISTVTLNYWKKKLNQNKAETSPGGGEALLDELQRLRRETSEQKKIIHILKGAAAFFSQDHLK
jgi:transposase